MLSSACWVERGISKVRINVLSAIQLGSVDVNGFVIFYAGSPNEKPHEAFTVSIGVEVNMPSSIILK
jgi:hypothetical protein